MRSALIASLLIIAGGIAYAGPVFPSRSFIIAPQFRSENDTVKGAAFFRQQGIWGDIFHGFNSTGDRYYWSISTGGIIQIVEWDHSAISLIGDYEMVGDQHSSIHFHPRGIFWTEGLLYMNKVGATEFSAGYINRCHHDIDDLEQQTVGNAEERTLIYSSILERAVWRDLDILGAHSSLWAQLDEYVFKQDYLIPVPRIQPATDMTKLIASVSGGGAFGLFPVGSTEVYLRAAFTESAYNSFKTFTLDTRAELGFKIKGSATTMNVYLGGEVLQDDGTRPDPVNSRFIYLGVRFIGQNIGI